MTRGRTQENGDFCWPPVPKGIRILRRGGALGASSSRNTQNPRAEWVVPANQVCGELCGCCVAAGHCYIEMYRIQLSNLGMNAPAFKRKLICN